MKFELYEVWAEDSDLIDTTSSLIEAKIIAQQALDEGAEFVGVDSTLIKATRLTANGERVWMYGDNKPKWLDQFMENNFDEIAERMKQSVLTRPNMKQALESR
jgi:hypothetical protein